MVGILHTLIRWSITYYMLWYIIDNPEQIRISTYILYMLTIVKGSHPPPFFPSALLPRHFPSLLARHFWRATKKPASQTLSCLPSGNLTVRYWTWPIEKVDLPLKNGWISSSQTLSWPESKGSMLISHSEPLVYLRVKETPNPILGGFPGKIDPPAWLTTCYPLVMADIAMENHYFLMSKSTISMGHGFKFANCNSLPVNHPPKRPPSWHVKIIPKWLGLPHCAPGLWSSIPNNPRPNHESTAVLI